MNQTEQAAEVSKQAFEKVKTIAKQAYDKGFATGYGQGYEAGVAAANSMIPLDPNRKYA